MEDPPTFHGRSSELAALRAFVDQAGPGPRLGVVYGRRRQGKTTLVDRLCSERGGFSWCALQQSAHQLLADFSHAWSAFTGHADTRFTTWEAALTAALESGTAASPMPIVLDEVGWLIDAEPSFPSVLQRLLHPTRPVGGGAGARLILCGSDMGSMRRMIDVGAPLRGRTSLELIVRPFDFRDTARFWQVAKHPDVAFRLHAYLGGTPAHRAYIGGAIPANDAGVDDWVADHLLAPTSPLLREGRLVMAEDANLNDRALYGSIVAAVAAGARSRGEIGSEIGRSTGALAHPLAVLCESGWMDAESDVLSERSTTFHIAEPIVRFHRLVIEPHEARLAFRDRRSLWEGTAAIVASKIHGPHLESLAKHWVLAYASEATLGGNPDVVGSAQLRAAGGVQADVVVAERSGHGRVRVTAVGECKATDQRVGEPVLSRLDATVDALAAQRPQVESHACRRLLFSRAGFTTGLQRVARRRGDVELIDLDRLLAGT